MYDFDAVKFRTFIIRALDLAARSIFSVAYFAAWVIDFVFAAAVTFESAALKLDKAGELLEVVTFLEWRGCIACFITCVVDAEWWCVLTISIPP
jgi:hypothetical protein